VPLFVGLRSVDIRDRFSIREIVERAAARLAALYVKHLKPDA
jgi:DNA-binding GntR family transcriptional regulator